MHRFCFLLLTTLIFDLALSQDNASTINTYGLNYIRFDILHIKKLRIPERGSQAPLNRQALWAELSRGTALLNDRAMIDRINRTQRVLNISLENYRNPRASAESRHVSLMNILNLGPHFFRLMQVRERYVARINHWKQQLGRQANFNARSIAQIRSLNTMPRAVSQLRSLYTVPRSGSAPEVVNRDFRNAFERFLRNSASPARGGGNRSPVRSGTPEIDIPGVAN